MSATNSDGYYGFQQLDTANNDFNAQAFMITQMLSKVRSCTLAQVVGVEEVEGLNPVGFVDVQCMVNQVSGAAVAVAHGPVYHVPYIRIQGGANAFVVDPEVGDIGLLCIADSDISSVKASRAIANPGSQRKFDLADSIFIGGWSSKTPVRYVQITDDGITIQGDQQVTINATNVAVNASSASVTASTISLTGTTTQNGNMTIQGSLTVTENIAVTGDLTTQGGSISMSEHVHTVESAPGTTSGPQG